MVPLSFGCGSAVFAAIARLAPSRAARSAMASPMPRLAPETNSVLPCSDVIGVPPVRDAPDRGGDLHRLGWFGRAYDVCAKAFLTGLWSAAPGCADVSIYSDALVRQIQPLIALRPRIHVFADRRRR